MLSIAKFLLFLASNYFFGFVFLSQITKIRSLILLLPMSFSFGIGIYIFLLHSSSFLLGPQTSAIAVLLFQVISAALVLFIKRKNLTKIKNEASARNFIILISIAIIICILTFFGVYRYGTFDRDVHMPMAMTMFHNNVYPPRDPFRPDYVFLYHYGGDLLAGAINYITSFDISRSYELVSTMFSGITFLSFFALAWILTKSFKLSFIAGFCTYFGGGLLWLDAIVRYLTKNFPEGVNNWSFLQTYLNLGFHGSIINPPSILTFSSTSVIGNPLLICCLILIWKMIEKNSLKESSLYMLFLAASLFSLYLTTDWLYVTFWTTTMSFLLILFFNKQIKIFIPIFILLGISGLLSKTIGNPLFLQDSLQKLGRTNIFDIGIKENLFTIVSWGRLSSHIMNYQTISCFSWDFLCEFGLSLLLLPIAIIYLIKAKNKFAILLFLSAFTTMPVPCIIDFKLNPVELVRLFAFGNSMIVLLITCGIGTLYKTIFERKIFLIPYLLCFCLSPISQLISADLFTPRVFTNKLLVEKMTGDLRNIKSIQNLIIYFKEFNDFVMSSKDSVIHNFKSEINFFKKHGNSGDVAISNLFEIPSHAGVYSIIPSGRFIYWDQLYSSHCTIFPVVFSTLDPYLLNELNIKWLFVTNDYKNTLPTESKESLSNPELFELAYKNNNLPQAGGVFEIYHTKDLKNILPNYERKTAWILVNKQGQILDIVTLHKNTITLFSSSKDALFNLNNLYKISPELKKELITTQPIIISSLENQIKTANLGINLDKKF